MKSLASNPDNAGSFCVLEEGAGRAPSLMAAEATCCFTSRFHVLAWQEEGCFNRVAAKDLWSSQALVLQARVATFPFLLLRTSSCRTCGAKESLLNVFQALRVLIPQCSKLPKRTGGSK